MPHIRYFLNKGYDVGVAANTENSDVSRIEEFGVTIHHVPFSRKLFDKGNLKSYKIMKNIMKDYHILHLHTPISSFITRLASSKSHKVIYNVHGFHFNENGKWTTNQLYLATEKIAALKSDKIIITNLDDLKIAYKIASEKKICYVNGVGLDTNLYNIEKFLSQDKQTIKLELGLDQNKKILTHIAEFNDNKRQIDIVNACELLKEKTQDFIILLVGTGENFEGIQRYIQEKHLDKFIKCLGFRKDIPRILSVTDIGLLVSIREGLPRSIMEMMAMKVPVVATNIRGNRDLVTNGENGFLIPIKNREEIAKKCFVLMSNEDLSNQYGEVGRQIIEDYFSIETVLQQMEKVYRELDIV
ncbi:glycosyltransferase family 4 protein [Bacillus sp. RG28]|uniref:Glycosyltransferase family 4 protein n=2 Tax=Gottfriedia endophytica TaxID=2820819 RepID=A0A940SJ31_9BACI|nr:glycosyltransferase family 4 protein [Gottfriedia endophytica]MBP0724474.1 glycosyltransferase family 4 protein [Gottfriedia endophytica]